jgi:hypothetical protein
MEGDPLTFGLWTLEPPQIHLFVDRPKASRTSTQNQAVTEVEREGFLDRL